MQSANKILSFTETLKKVAEWKASGDKTVFSNGCFDIIHAGHVDYLEKARQKGDRLVVGLNTDNSISRIKGKNRPILMRFPGREYWPPWSLLMSWFCSMKTHRMN